MGEYITRDERLRRIGEILLKGVYLWAEATEGAEFVSPSHPNGAMYSAAILVEARTVDDQTNTAASMAHDTDGRSSPHGPRGGVARRSPGRSSRRSQAIQDLDR